MKLTQLSVLALLAITSQGAFAQSRGASSGMPQSASIGSPGGSPSGPSSAGGSSTAGSTDASAVTNAGSAFVGDSSMEMTDTSTTSTSTVDVMPTGEMANTGGEPEIMLLAGMLLATGGLLIRRKAGAQSL
ncbi:hypothetical protein EON83_26200 [bacterium]|nr:MAG: hypothetical protein EON83_26200 [bacterium]